MWSRIRARLSTLMAGRAIEREIDEELAFHLDREIEALVARGVPPADARRMALRAIGGITQARESVQAMRSLGLDAWWNDIRHGARSLLTGRRFTVAALFTIVLTVGGISTVFTLVNAVLLRPLPYPDAERLVLVTAEDPDRRGPSLTFADVEMLAARATTVDAWAVFTPRYVNTLDPESENPIPVQDMRVRPSVFPMFGIEVVLGRPLLESDTDPTNPDVALISHDLWLSRFGGRPDVIGQIVPGRGDMARTIVGVTAPSADLPMHWLPMSMPMVWSAARHPLPMRSSVVVARLRSDADLAAIGSELSAISDSLEATNAEATGQRRIRTRPLLDAIVGETGRVLWIFFAAVASVLFIGVANLVSLQTVRNTARERELHLRAALGASRWRLIRQLLVETVMLSLAGGAFGLLAAMGGVRVVTMFLPPQFPRADGITVDLTVTLFTFGVAMAVAVVVGVLPGWLASRPQLAAALNEGSRTSTLNVRRSQLQRLVIATETALALVLLVGAGLLVHSFGRLMTEPAGMEEVNLWAATIELPARYQGPQLDRYWLDALQSVRALPQVASAAIAVNSGGPLSGGDIGTRVRPYGVSSSTSDTQVSFRLVGGDYFSTLGIPLVQGRPILETDTETSERVVVVNELAAASLWPGDEALGKQIAFMNRPTTVVGIIPTFTITAIQNEPSAQLYFPHAQEFDHGVATLMLRVASGSTGVSEAVTALAKNLEPDAQVQVRTMAGVRWQQLATERFRTGVLLVFAGTAVFLAVVGIFGVVSHSVVSRTREIGLRVALGAPRGRIVALVVRQTLVPCLVGLVVGAVGALAAARLLSAYLFGVEPTDPATIVACIALLAVAGLIAALVPARRVNAISPMEALRHE